MEMIKDDEIMSAEEFFGEIDNGRKSSSRMSLPRGKKSADDLFAKMKVKMVMRIYGASRAKALEIITTRDAAKAAAVGESQIGGNRGDTNEALMSAEDFFA